MFSRTAVLALIFSLFVGVAMAVQTTLVVPAAAAVEATVPAIQSTTSEAALRSVSMVIGVLSLVLCFHQALFPRRAPRRVPVKVEKK